jgi:hypothetical protein
MIETRTRTTVRGALDEGNDIYHKAMALEEGTGEEDDLEGLVPTRPVSRVHSLKISLAMMLVVFTQVIGVSKVGYIDTFGVALRLMLMDT